MTHSDEDDKKHRHEHYRHHYHHERHHHRRRSSDDANGKKHSGEHRRRSSADRERRRRSTDSGNKKAGAHHHRHSGERRRSSPAHHGGERRHSGGPHHQNHHVEEAALGAIGHIHRHSHDSADEKITKVKDWIGRGSKDDDIVDWHIPKHEGKKDSKDSGKKGRTSKGSFDTNHNWPAAAPLGEKEPGKAVLKSVCPKCHSVKGDSVSCPTCKMMGPSPSSKDVCSSCGKGHYRKRVTTTGYLAAVLLFPIGTMLCLTKKCCVKEVCSNCGHYRKK